MVCVAVVKGKRNQSDVEYFDYAYKVVEHITKFLLSDLGIKKTYRDLKVFAYKTHMNETDKEELSFGTVGNFDESQFEFLSPDQCIRLQN